MSRRNKPELVDELDHALRLDVRLRDITAERDGIRAKVNEVSKNVGALRKSGDTTAAEKLMAESRELGDKEVSLAGEYEEVSAALRNVLLRLPNVPHPEVVKGVGDTENPVIKGPVNMPSTFPEYQRVAHWDTATALGILDNERAVKISGAMLRCNAGPVQRSLAHYVSTHCT